MTKSFAEQEVDTLSEAWQLHLSGFVSPIVFLGWQRPPHYYRDYKSGLWVAAEDNEALLGYSTTDRDVVECFIVGG
jgi:hypothetical protein